MMASIRIFALAALTALMLHGAGLAQEETSPPPMPSTEVPALLPDGSQADTSKQPVSAGAILTNCAPFTQGQFNTRENTARRSACLNYFFGVASSFLLLQAYGKETGLCLPPDLSVQDVFSKFIGWARQNQEYINGMAATEGVYRTLQESYACLELESGKNIEIP